MAVSKTADSGSTPGTFAKEVILKYCREREAFREGGGKTAFYVTGVDAPGPGAVASKDSAPIRSITRWGIRTFSSVGQSYRLITGLS